MTELPTCILSSRARPINESGSIPVVIRNTAQQLAHDSKNKRERRLGMRDGRSAEAKIVLPHVSLQKKSIMDKKQYRKDICSSS